MGPRRRSISPDSAKRAVATGRILRPRKNPPQVPRCSLKEPIETSKPCPNLPNVAGSPPAWAECRPDLADAIPWFRCVQGGVYHSGNLCWGFLIDADCGIRSYVDDEIVITRVGGGCAKNADGKLIQLKDQDSESTIVKSIMNSKNNNVPVGLIIGDRNNLLGKKIPHRYNVMAFFRVSNVWYEKIGNKIGARVRFEKLDLSSKSWWASEGSLSPVPAHKRNYSIKPESLQCSDCHLSSTRIYDEGWMCLNTVCGSFWKLGPHTPPENLTYYQSFLASRSFHDPDMQPHYSLVPNLLSTIREHDRDVSSSRIVWKGIVCPQCSKCISRRFWNRWKCTDAPPSSPGTMESGCSFEKIMQMHPISLRSVIDEFELSPIRRAVFFDHRFAIPDIDDRSTYPYRKLTYNIPGVGSITHFLANKAINGRANGPNDMFEQLQVADTGLRRYPLQQSVVPGTLTAHFAVNYGLPYKYVVSVDSRGFNEAPEVILRSLGRLTWATERAVLSTGDQPLPPNELLLLGYFEEMKIGYHDDGESSLGPTIATLSLGAKATMLLRMKYKYYHGFSKAKNLLDDDPVLDSCQSYDERLALKCQLNEGRLTSAEYNQLRQDMLKGRRNGDAPPLIKMELNHGDLVVMHGANLQKFYEHSVTPEKKLRFALTARYIQPEDVDPSDLGKGEFTLKPDQIYDGK